MLGQFYYLNATLPALALEEPPPFSGKEFLSLCRGHLNDADYAAIAGSVLWDAESQDPARPVWHRWQAFERGLRGCLAVRRAQQLGWENEGFDIGDSVIVKDAAEAAFEEKDPLAAEGRLFQARWRFLSEVDAETFMTLENLILYFLKLQLLERKHGMSAEGGRRALANLRRIVETELPTGDIFAATEEPAQTA